MPLRHTSWTRSGGYSPRTKSLKCCTENCLSNQWSLPLTTAITAGTVDSRSLWLMTLSSCALMTPAPTPEYIVIHYNLPQFNTYRHTYTQTISAAIFSSESELASCCINFPSLFIVHHYGTGPNSSYPQSYSQAIILFSQYSSSNL